MPWRRWTPRWTGGSPERSRSCRTVGRTSRPISAGRAKVGWACTSRRNLRSTRRRRRSGACSEPLGFTGTLPRSEKVTASMPVGESIPLYMCVPFVLFLLLIAILPLAFPRFWEKKRNKAIISALVSLPVLPFLLTRLPAELGRTAEDYVSFILLLASLFIISGGILLTGDLRAPPAVKRGLLLL